MVLSKIEQLFRRPFLQRMSGIRSQGGQDLVEYALMAGFIAVAIAATIPYLVEGPMRHIYETAVSLLQRSGGA
jgi:Flp pilus assembly pilin Flp